MLFRSQFLGRLSYIKVITGTFSADSEVFNIGENRKEKVGKLYRCTDKKLEEIKSLCAGDIGIAVKLPSARTSDTLASDAACLPFVRLRHPEPGSCSRSGGKMGDSGSSNLQILS